MTPAQVAAQAGLQPKPAVTAMLAKWQGAVAALGPRTIVMIDPRTGGPASVQPDGLPWIPGTGINNHLTRADLAAFMPQSAVPDDPRDPPDRNGVNQAVLERIARSFMTQHADWFPVPQNQLVSQILELDPNDDVRHVLFYQEVNGIRVEGAMLTFHIGHGNLLSFGGQYMAPLTLSVTPSITPADVVSVVNGYTALPDMSKVSVVAAPRLKLVVRDDTGGVLAGGYQHQLLFDYVFRVSGEMGTWRAEVDAHTGQLVSFGDSNEYVRNFGGGVYPVSNDGTCPSGCEGAVTSPDPMPFAYYNSTGAGCAGGSLSTDTGGNYPAATAGTVRFGGCGPYVLVNNNGVCTADPNESVTAPADINLGTGAFTASGTDCAIPANGTPLPHVLGNNHSTRTAFYNVNKYKEAIRGWRPTWTFINNRVTVNVNLNQVCNAYWNGSTLNMFKYGTTSGITCRNTGEIAAVFDHELGHGMDGSESGNSRPGEAYADGGSILHHHDACFGRGFFTARQCGGYGDACTTCTGVRGANWTGHVSGRPHTIFDLQSGNNTAPNTSMQCPAGGDICGFETHCAAYPIIEAHWDAATIDLPHNAIPPNGGAACANTSPGNPITQNQSWFFMMRAFFLSSPTLGDQYSCPANPALGTAGCGAATLFHLMKVQEDDDGNLANGTPHAAEMQCAYGRHQVGCLTDNNVDSGCAAPVGTPVVTATGGPGTNEISLSWTAATNAANYRIFRGEEGCGGGFALIATVAAPTTTYLSTGLTQGRTYNYQVQAVSSVVQCDGDPSACATADAGPGACSAPSGFANNTAVDAGTSCNATGVTVTWTAPSAWGDTSGTRTYDVLRNAVALPAGTGLSSATLNFTDATAVAGTAYTYSVKANNGCGSSTTTAGVSATDLTGTAPSGLANNAAADINACTATGNSVTWTAPTGWNDNGSGTRTWTVLRNGVNPGAGPCNGNLAVGTLTCNDTNATAGTAYTYTVRANNGCGNQTTTTGVSATDLQGTAPSGLANNTAADINACTATGNSVTWTAPTGWNDNASGTRTWTVLRNGVNPGAGPCNGSLAVGTLSCNDTNAAGGTAYTYTVRANNGCALQTTSAPGTSATDDSDVTAPASPAHALAKATPNINFSWPAVPTTTNYTNYSAATPNPGAWTSRNVTATLGWTNASDLGTGTTLFYTTTAMDACLNESPQ